LRDGRVIPFVGAGVSINAPAEQAEYLRRGELRAPTVWHLHGHIDNAAELILTPNGYASLYSAVGETEPRQLAEIDDAQQALLTESFGAAAASMRERRRASSWKTSWPG